MAKVLADDIHIFFAAEQKLLGFSRSKLFANLGNPILVIDSHPGGNRGIHTPEAIVAQPSAPWEREPVSQATIAWGQHAFGTNFRFVSSETADGKFDGGRMSRGRAGTRWWCLALPLAPLTPQPADCVLPAWAP